MLRTILALGAFALVLAGCGGDGARASDAAEPPAATASASAASAASSATRPLTRTERRFVRAFARALAADVRRHGPRRRLVRAVVRWTDPLDPLHFFTVHVLTAAARERVPARDAWYPLEWPNVEAELKRTRRLAAHPRVRSTGRALTRLYERDLTLQEGAGTWSDAFHPSPAVVAIVRRIPGALRAAGVKVHDELAVSAAHFEGWGIREVLDRTAQPGVLAALDARGELPEE